MNSEPRIIRHPLFIKMRTGFLDQDYFLKRFVYFQKIIGEWSILLTNLLAKEQNKEKRIALSHALLGELGYGNPEEFGVYTFIKFIKFMNSEISAACDDSVRKHTRAFINILHSLSEEPESDLVYAFIKQVEKMHIEVSEEICDYVKTLRGDPSIYVPHFSDKKKISNFKNMFDPASEAAKRGKYTASVFFWDVFYDFQE